ncbi:uncharacterized protein LOC6617173 [Drosophila sechellia]|uniref:GM10110 n=1 Tax=Drosophila sechellia TaxID=7238 RepID=B4IC80_DROSE|nr:uncharacterized protein LOC6617173 [Drosophila sechellia]EDW45238.1 GM10110 [Drosophila sechellia]
MATASAHLPIQKRRPHEHNGEPSCQGLDEVNRMFRNYWDPTAYWVCDKQGTRARLQRCPQAQLYSEELGRCVHYADWAWTDPKEPAGRAKISQSVSTN